MPQTIDEMNKAESDTTRRILEFFRGQEPLTGFTFEEIIDKAFPRESHRRTRLLVEETLAALCTMEGSRIYRRTSGGEVWFFRVEPRGFT